MFDYSNFSSGDSMESIMDIMRKRRNEEDAQLALSVASVAEKEQANVAKNDAARHLADVTEARNKTTAKTLEDYEREGWTRIGNGAMKPTGAGYVMSEDPATNAILTAQARVDELADATPRYSAFRSGRLANQRALDYKRDTARDELNAARENQATTALRQRAIEQSELAAAKAEGQMRADLRAQGRSDEEIGRLVTTARQAKALKDAVEGASATGEFPLAEENARKRSEVTLKKAKGEEAETDRVTELNRRLGGLRDSFAEGSLRNSIDESEYERARRDAKIAAGFPVSEVLADKAKLDLLMKQIRAGGMNTDAEIGLIPAKTEKTAKQLEYDIKDADDKLANLVKDRAIERDYMSTRAANAKLLSTLPAAKQAAIQAMVLAEGGQLDSEGKILKMPTNPSAELNAALGYGVKVKGDRGSSAKEFNWLTAP